MPELAAMSPEAGSSTRPRVFSGIKPTGQPQLGNYLGAMRHWVAGQDDEDGLFCIVDLHALTVEHDPAEVRVLTLGLAQILLAVGLDPERCTLFVQSHVPEHTELNWLMESTASYGEMHRMVQFKEKSKGQETVRLSLLTYPALMAADILLYNTDRVPIGDDQRQHLELARNIATRFNHRYGDTFVVPEGAFPPVGARIMDLQEPTGKMGKSHDSPMGTVYILDDPKDIERKIKRAVTDTDGEVRFDPQNKPGVSNLLSILGAATGGDPVKLAEGYSQYGPLKNDTAAAVIELLRPVQARHAELAGDPAQVAQILAAGAAKARATASVTVTRAKQAIGLLPA
jgi:tryptophanyl-tRNA synthetase